MVGENTRCGLGGPRDDFALDTHGQCSTDRRQSGPRPAPAQFGLRGLIWFMVACSVYFAQLAFVLKAGGVEESLTLPNMATVAIGWLLLAIYYLRIHFRLALIVHCAGLEPTSSSWFSCRRCGCSLLTVSS